MRAGVTALLAGATVLVLAWAAVPASAAGPLIGATYTHTAIAADCNLDRPRSGVVLTYDEPGVRRLVRAQLAAMRAARVETISTLLWHMSQIGTHSWGIIPSANGRLTEPYRSNLIRFTRDVRAAGFARFTVRFGPEWTNSPVGIYGPAGLIQDVWEPVKFEENWGFIREARALVKEHGPLDTRFDLGNELPPSPYQPAHIVERLKTYMAEMWRRYVSAFGKSDATISIIGKGYDLAGTERFKNFLDALTSTGQSLPDWFELHPSWSSPDLFQQLSAFDRTLSGLGLSQPLVVGESAYEDPAAARDVARFVASTSRPVLEVYQWWQAVEGERCFAAPYRADAYRAALRGEPAAPPTPSPLPLAPVPTLRATVDSRSITLKTADGKRVTSLDAGLYRIVVDDRSRTESFQLEGPNRFEQTEVRFRGRKVWTLELGVTDPYGSRFTYSSGGTRSLRGSFTVL